MASRTKGTRGGGPPPAAVVDEDEVDDLYKKPLGDFTRARDDLAKRLRQAGDKAAAERVKALRRPTAAAWTLNQLARRYPQRMEALLDAGERLREAQRGALAPGGAQELREASQSHRAIVNELLRAAPALFAEGGYSEKGNPMDRLRDSLLATPTASASDLELLARGRVSGEIEPGDLSDMLGLLRGRPSERPAEADDEATADRGRKTKKAEAPPPKRREAREAPEKQRRAAEERDRKEQRSAKEREQEDQRRAKERKKQRSAKEREHEAQRSAKEREKQRSAKEREQKAQRAAEERERKARSEAGEREKKAQLAAERRARKERLAAEQREQKAQLAAAERERDQASREAGRAAREADRLTKEAARMSRAAEKAEEAARAARKRADEAERKAAEAQQKAADSAGRLEAAEDTLDGLGR
ncbi:hypothetical protein [Sorangium sp. So ce233]|uniref:hypothetical protein n=1 Tax=Sorangium sp. So ce233 TaxID=3133290 RepID=UPI003F608D65